MPASEQPGRHASPADPGEERLFSGGSGKRVQKATQPLYCEKTPNLPPKSPTNHGGPEQGSFKSQLKARQRPPAYSRLQVPGVQRAPGLATQRRESEPPGREDAGARVLLHDQGRERRENRQRRRLRGSDPGVRSGESRLRAEQRGDSEANLRRP
ncbi:hypothetical protein HWI79_3624 [Cryptosporidium felis]|nr:hypothetical protein HWI79_3624 [Cryptosporidium felis]